MALTSIQYRKKKYIYLFRISYIIIIFAFVACGSLGLGWRLNNSNFVTIQIMHIPYTTYALCCMRESAMYSKAVEYEWIHDGATIKEGNERKHF